MPSPKIADLIASKLRDGIVHPGDPAKNVQPRTIALPFGMRAGQPQEMLDLMDATTTMLAEAIVHIIETDGDTALVPRDELEVLQAAVLDGGALIRSLSRRDPACPHKWMEE
jgi:hypothetical protein